MIFEKEGRENTEKTVELAVKAAKERGIKNIVVATYVGYTPSYLEKQDLGDIHVTIVTPSYGYAGKGKCQFPEEKRKYYTDRGWSVVTAAHILSGVERSFSKTNKGIYPGEVVAQTLKLFSRGTKVCLEISLMACDAGCIMPGEPVIAIGGSGGGADTAIILRPSNSHKLFDTRLDEFICKPLAALED